MYLYGVNPSLHETLLSARIRAEDRGNVRGSIDARLHGMPEAVPAFDAALAEMKSTLRATKQLRDLYRLDFTFDQGGHPTECRIVIGKRVAIVVTTVAFISRVRVKLSGPVEFESKRPEGPGFVSDVAPFLAEALNHSQPIRRAAQAILRSQYKIGAVTVTIEPHLSLRPLNGESADSTEAELKVVTTLHRQPIGLGFSLGVRDFARLREAIERELA